MTLQQLATVKRWHLTHPQGNTLEYHVWDLMLTCWVLGLVGVAPAALLGLHPVIGLCVVLHLAPSLYVALRRRLHRRGVLRCDWLGSLR